MKLRVELVWEEEEGKPSSSIFLTSDGKILLQGFEVDEEERARLAIPDGQSVISVDRRFVDAVKTFL